MKPFWEGDWTPRVGYPDVTSWNHTSKKQITHHLSSWWLNQPTLKKMRTSNWIISPSRDQNTTYLKPPPRFGYPDTANAIMNPILNGSPHLIIKLNHPGKSEVSNKLPLNQFTGWKNTIASKLPWKKKRIPFENKKTWVSQTNHNQPTPPKKHR